MANKAATITAYNIAEASRRLGVSRWTIMRAIHDGKLAATQTGRRSVVIYSDDLLDYVLRYRQGRGIEA